MVARNLVQSKKVRRDDLSGEIFNGVGVGPHHGVLVLHGSSQLGDNERRYAQYLAHHGYTAFCVEYFGNKGTPQTLARIPLAYFNRAIEWLLKQPGVKQQPVGVVGFSRGGEVALLIGAEFNEIGAVVGYVPSGYIFPAPTWMTDVDGDVPAWTKDEEPVPYIPLDGVGENLNEANDDPFETEDPDINLEAIANASPEAVSQATINVEDIDGPVLLISGGADDVWPSTKLADVAAQRLNNNDHSWQSNHLTFPDAGHAIGAPYRFEAEHNIYEKHRFGGTLGANARASAEAWLEAIEFLRQGLRMRNTSSE